MHFAGGRPISAHLAGMLATSVLLRQCVLTVILLILLHRIQVSAFLHIHRVLSRCPQLAWSSQGLNL